MTKPQTATTFEPLTTLTATVAAIPGPNVDTDQIIPARFLKKDRSLGYGQFLFHDTRFDDAGNQKPHPLNTAKDQTPKVLMVDENFGCGSSREGAVYALADYGIRALVGTTFGDIFHNNCFKNGVLPVRLEATDHARLMQWVATLTSPADITVDLVQCEVRWDKDCAKFTVDDFWRECLIKGLDELSLTLSHTQDIDTFESQYQSRFPWLVANKA
jgi:3-isopropylmalate/(R)-2-methylmalate dehydratase small subunit|uniref:3-isopropylmalate dehydratase small subunit n=1 Tax=Orrella sp. TaxID=1921583 RepID=UPI0040482BB6